MKILFLSFSFFSDIWSFILVRNEFWAKKGLGAKCWLQLKMVETVLFLSVHLGFLGGSDGKQSSCSAGDLGLIPGLGRSAGGRHGNPFQYSCLENPHGQKSLTGYSPWGCKEPDMTE